MVQALTPSVLEIFRVGIGPSSSHTVGPMRAAARFLEALDLTGRLGEVASVTVHLYGSLAATGKSHGTDQALLLGLEGEQADTVDVDAIPGRLERIRARGRLELGKVREIGFVESQHLVLHRRERLARHPNALRFVASASDGSLVLERTYYSVGGGFLLDDEAPGREAPPPVPFAFSSARELLAHCAAAGTSVAGIVLENERALQPEASLRSGLLGVWRAMDESIERGLAAEGVLPGFLRLRRRAPGLHRRLLERRLVGDRCEAMDWLNCYALAVSEENAAGGRVAAAPTNGAAGIVPAVLRHCLDEGYVSTEDQIVDFLLTAGAIAMLCKAEASISGAEVGCQGEVGSACAMAAAAFCAAGGGTPPQVENAAEIAVEHHLGLTCDPVGGFVQVPCIERNAVAAVTAVDAAHIALAGDGRHVVSLDQALATLRQTGADMKTKYKETSLGGLALNVVEC